jgi:hypothetical protein
VSGAARRGGGPRKGTPPRKRRALGASGGAVERTGDVEAAQRLEAALHAATGEGAELTHGFHTYPARMHPGVARALCAAFGAPGQRLLDPFCGGGTVLIEAMVAGLRAAGVDLNPLATAIAGVQCELRDESARTRFELTLAQVTEASLARVRARVPVKAELSARERANYEPHVLLELAGLRKEIGEVGDDADRRALLVVLSSLLVKFSRQRADTSEEHVSKRIRKGLASEFFLRKGGELSRRWAALRQAVPAAAREPLLVTGDARELPALLGRGALADLVVSSPPYGGTYDYHAHHARRALAQELEQREVGARRRLSRAPDAHGQWDRELAACLRAIAAMCRPDARVVLLLGDAQVGGTRVDARAQIGKLAKPAGLELVASAAQRRADHLGGPPRREHLLLLVKRA